MAGETRSEHAAFFVPAEELGAEVAQVRGAPGDNGTVELIVARPAVDERTVVSEASFDVDDGMVGDTWRARGNAKTPDGSSDPLAQVTIMGSRAAALIAGPRARWPLAGDQLFVDLDLSGKNLPAGTRLSLGTLVLEVTAKPHTGCTKFAARFGSDAWRFVNSEAGRELNLRGINAAVVVAGAVRTGDTIRKVS